MRLRFLRRRRWWPEFSRAGTGDGINARKGQNQRAGSTRDDPHYNVYAPNQGRPSLMQSADRLNSRLDEGLSDLDTRLDRLLD